MVAVEGARRCKVLVSALSSKANSAEGSDTFRDISRRRRHFDPQSIRLPMPRQQNQHGGQMEKRRQRMASQNAEAIANAMAVTDE